MNNKHCESYNISIYIAGDIEVARDICRKYCDEVGLCVTLTPTEYIYTGGSDLGMIIGLINYPRFPGIIENSEKAVKLALILIEGLGQQSCSIVTPLRTVMYYTDDKDMS